MKRHLFAMSTTVAAILLLCQETADTQEVTSQRYVPLPLIHMKVGLVAKKLTAILGTKVDIFAHEHSNTLFIRGNAENVERCKAIIKQIDMPSHLYVIPLKNASAAKTANTLKAVLDLLAIFGDDRDVRVIADGRGDSILIYASEEKANEVRKMIPWLDVKVK